MTLIWDFKKDLNADMNVSRP